MMAECRIPGFLRGRNLQRQWEKCWEVKCMRKVLSKVTPIFLCAFLTVESVISSPLQAYAYDYDEEITLFECPNEEALDEEQDGEQIEEDQELTGLEDAEDEASEEVAEELSEELEILDDTEELSEELEILDDTDEASDEDAADLKEESVAATAADDGMNHKCGDNATWRVEEVDSTFGKKYVIIIEGTGAIYDYSEENTCPWMELLNKTCKIVVSDGITEIGEYAFYYGIGSTIHSIHDVEIADSVDRIDKYAFGRINIHYLKLPASMDRIEDYAFRECHFDYYGEIVFPKKVRYIGDYAFYNAPNFKCGIVFEGTEEIGDYAFVGVHMTSITFTDSLKRIGEYAFSCSGIDEKMRVDIPARVQEIGEGAFRYCECAGIYFWGGVPASISKKSLKAQKVFYPVEYPEWEEFVNNAEDSEEEPATYAPFKSRCTVTFHCPYGEVIQQEYKGFSKITAPDLKLNAGDKIYNWYTEEEYQWEKTRYNFENELQDDLDLYARLESDDCRVIFDTGCDIVVPEQAVPGGKTATEPEVPERDDYVLVEWVEGENVGYKRSFDFSTALYEDILLTAVWGDAHIVTATGGEYNFYYTGSPITLPDIHVYVGGKEVEASDYTVKYRKNVNVGEAYCDIKLKGNYSGSCVIPFYINEAELDDNMSRTHVYLLEDIKYVKYDGQVHKERPILFMPTKSGYYILQEGKDYLLDYEESKYNDYRSVGEYYVDVWGIGNFDGIMTFIINITTQKNIENAKVKIVGSRDYTGTPLTPEVSVTYNGKKLVAGEYEDYTVVYDGSSSAGTARLYIVAGKHSDYCGIKVVKYEILGDSIKEAEISGIEDKIFNGYPAQQDNLKLLCFGHELLGVSVFDYQNRTSADQYADCSYTYEYKANNSAGTAKLIIRGINRYTGTVTKTFKIGKCSLENVDQVKVNSEVNYGTKAAKPEVIIEHNGLILENGKDYTVTYSANKKPGTATVKIKGKGNFSGTVTKQFEIKKTVIKDLEVSVENVAFKKSGFINAPVITVYDSEGNKLKFGKDLKKNITYTYANDVTVIQNKKPVTRAAGDKVGKKDVIEVGTILECTLTGMGGFTGEAKAQFKVVKTSIASAKVKVPAYNYKGKPIVPSKSDITVKVGKVTLGSEDYEIVSCTNNTKAGKATIVIRGKGNYGGTVKATFKIKPFKVYE